ncbi:MAG: nitrilase-related carbon-nitrogen hydrolase, partial [Acidobacteriota bacterium]
MGKIAVVQHPPVLLDRNSTLEKAVSLTKEAANDGAEVVVFPEAFIPGYPTWIWRLRPGGDMKLTDQLYDQLIKNAVDLSKDDLAPLCDAAKRHGVHILCGIDERDDTLSRSTLYNTYITIDPDGQICNKHRKLMPTNPERMVWGFG